MGFTDLLSSSRGPGVIGTLLALLVLVGFGTLYLFVFDEGLQGGQKTIEAVIRDQGLEIENHKIQIQNARERLERAAVFKAKGKEADDLKVRAEIAGKRTDRVEPCVELDETVVGDGTRGRLEAVHAAIARRNPDGAQRIGAEGEIAFSHFQMITFAHYYPFNAAAPLTISVSSVVMAA